MCLDLAQRFNFPVCLCLLVVGCNRQLIWILIIYVCLLLAEALILMIFESPVEHNIKNDTLASVSEMFHVVMESHNLTDKQIWGTMWRAQILHHRDKDNATKPLPFVNAAFFAYTLISTIGYGDVAPHKSINMLLCVLYSFIGIPLHLFMVRLMGLKLRLLVRDAIEYTEDSRLGSNVAVAVCVCGIIVLAMGVFLVLPAVLLIYTEGWSFIEGLYYSIITLATVGLGDYVARGRKVSNAFHEVFMLLLFSWLIWGATFMNTFTNLLAYFFRVKVLDRPFFGGEQPSREMTPNASILHNAEKLLWLLSVYMPKRERGKRTQDTRWLDELEVFIHDYNQDPKALTEARFANLCKVLKELRSAALISLGETTSPNGNRPRLTISTADLLALPRPSNNEDTSQHDIGAARPASISPRLTMTDVDLLALPGPSNYRNTNHHADR